MTLNIWFSSNHHTVLVLCITALLTLTELPRTFSSLLVSCSDNACTLDGVLFSDSEIHSEFPPLPDLALDCRPGVVIGE